MREATALVVFLLLLSTACQNKHSQKAGDLKRPEKSEKLAPAQFEFQKEIHNFGSLKAGEVVSYTFVMTNKGATRFWIDSVHSSCGCITADFQAEAILPGQKTTIEVVFNTEGEWGNQLKSVIIKTLDGKTKELVLAAHIENEYFDNLIKKQQ